MMIRSDLDLDTLSRKEGWRRWVDKPRREMPELMTAKQLSALDDDARDDYADIRGEWHANILVKTPEMEYNHEQLDDIEGTNRPQDVDRVRQSAVFDAPGGFGKTTTALAFAKKLDRSERRRHGQVTGAGHERLPVFHIRLTSKTTLRTLNQMICQFYGHPGADRPGNATMLGTYAVDCVLSCETRVGIIDDLHQVNPNRKDGAEVSNHLKWLSNEMPITFIFAGIDLYKMGYFEDEGATSASARRWTRLELSRFRIETDELRVQWINMLKGLERQLVLAQRHRGMLTDLSDYLFARTSGHIGSLMTLLTRGCRRAIRRGHERLDQDLLDGIKIDSGAEQARPELQAGFQAGRLRTAPARRTRAG